MEPKSNPILAPPDLAEVALAATVTSPALTGVSLAKTDEP